MTIPINSMVLGKLGTNGDRQTFGIGADGDPSPSLSTAHHHAVCYGINPQGGGMNPFDEELGETQSVCHQGEDMQVNENDLLKMRYIVRRLTPTEAERLMGLPDGYTIPIGLEVTDELVAEFQRIFDTFGAIMAEYEHTKPPKPKSANQVRAWLEKITDPATCPDSPRYKACGNGWATNQPRWILTRLIAIGENIDPFTGESLDETKDFCERKEARCGKAKVEK